MEIITLVENSCTVAGLREEFGLSLLVRSAEAAVLFDMGASALFRENAHAMGIDLSQVDFGVVSHAHYDHGGGLGTFLENNTKANVYLGREADKEYFANIGAKLPLFLEPLIYPLVRYRPGLCRSIGLDSSVFAEYSDRLISVENSLKIKENIFLFSGITGENPRGEGNKYLLEKRGDRLQPDRFVHELIMVIKEKDGLVLFTGCGHNGVLNMMQTVQRHFAEVPIKAVVGGFHLALQPGKPAIGGTEEDIRNIAVTMGEAGVKKVVTGHCTGADACHLLKEILGDRLVLFSTGSRITL